MDALNDVREDYIRGMLEDDGKETAAGKVGGTIMVSALPIRKHTGGAAKRHAEAGERIAGSKLRYPVLAASAAACVACIAGMMYLHKNVGLDSNTAESMLAVQDSQPETTLLPVTTAPDETAAAVTAVQVTSAAAVTTTYTGTGVQETEAAVLTVTGTDAPVQTEASAEQTRLSETEAAAQTTVTTVTTTAEPVAATTDSQFTVVPYEQSFPLGDADADGRVTLFDYLMGERALMQLYDNSAVSCVMDDNALDRGNIDRITGDIVMPTLHGKVNSPMSSEDVLIIRDAAIISAWLSDRTVTPEEFMETAKNSGYEYWNLRVENMDLLCELYAELAQHCDLGFSGTKEELIQKIPKRVREIFNFVMETDFENGPYIYYCSDTDFWKVRDVILDSAEWSIPN